METLLLQPECWVSEVFRVSIPQHVMFSNIYSCWISQIGMEFKLVSDFRDQQLNFLQPALILSIERVHVSVPARPDRLNEEHLQDCFSYGQIYVVNFQCLGLVIFSDGYSESWKLISAHSFFAAFRRCRCSYHRQCYGSWRRG